MPLLTWPPNVGVLYMFMAVVNLIDHGRRVLHWSRATYNPTAEWVAQQLRNAFMDLDELPEAIVMDRDSIFLPIVKQTLPAMGIKTIRIGYKCPWQNAVVERFHRTLADELLRDVQPVNDRHLNRLLCLPEAKTVQKPTAWQTKTTQKVAYRIFSPAHLGN